MPIYHVLPVHPVIGKVENKISPHKAKLAMAVRGSTNYFLNKKIQHRLWIAQTRQVDVVAEVAEQLIEGVIEFAESVIEAVGGLLPDAFPTNIAKAVVSTMKKHSAKLAAADKSY